MINFKHATLDLVTTLGPIRYMRHNNTFICFWHPSVGEFVVFERDGWSYRLSIRKCVEDLPQGIAIIIEFDKISKKLEIYCDPQDVIIPTRLKRQHKKSISL